MRGRGRTNVLRRFSGYIIHHPWLARRRSIEPSALWKLQWSRQGCCQPWHAQPKDSFDFALPAFSSQDHHGKPYNTAAIVFTFAANRTRSSTESWGIAASVVVDRCDNRLISARIHIPFNITDSARLTTYRIMAYTVAAETIDQIS